MLFYVGDLLHTYFNPKEDMYILNIIYRFKEELWPPEQYLGDNFDNLKLEDGQVFWYTNCVDDLNSTIEKVKNSIEVDNMEINNYGHGNRPYSSSFRTELYVAEGMVE